MKSTKALIALLGCLVSTSAVAEEDCTLGARYYGLAEDAKVAHDYDRAKRFLANATEACGQYEYWQEYGELLIEHFNSEEDMQSAATAYINAYRIAAEPEQEARSAAHYANMLLNSGDPQRALQYVHYARELQPDEAWIDELATKIDDRVQLAHMDDIKRGLEDVLFETMVLKQSAVLETADAGDAPKVELDQLALLTDTSGGGGVADSDAKRIPYFPVYFQFNSVELEPESVDKIRELAGLLVNEYQTSDFVFIGHADLRGSDAYNLGLSQRRAKSVEGMFVAMQPELRGRISTRGMGSRSPIRNGLSGEDHKMNRRLEVLIRD